MRVICGQIYKVNLASIVWILVTVLQLLDGRQLLLKVHRLSLAHKLLLHTTWVSYLPDAVSHACGGKDTASTVIS